MRLEPTAYAVAGSDRRVQPMMPSDQDRPDPIGDAAQDWILRLTSGDVTEAELQRFELWRNADPRHRAAFEEVRGLWTGIGDLRPAFASEQARSRDHAGSFVRRRGVLTGVALAACLLLFVAPVSQWRAWLMADQRTGIGEQATITLPDGSTVHLNADTAIDIDYSGTRRQVRLLYGEALFEVQKDSARPFEVLAVDGRTRAVGTAFVVRDAAEMATVTVSEGAVRVASPAKGDVSDATTLLEAGQQVSYQRGQAPGPVRGLDPAVATAWHQGSIVIRDQPLAEAFAEIGRYRPGKIVLLGDNAGRQPVTARIAIKDVDSGIDALAATHGLSVTRVTAYLIIVR